MPCDLCGAITHHGHPYKGEFYFCCDCNRVRCEIDMHERQRFSEYAGTGSRLYPWEREEAAA